MRILITGAAGFIGGHLAPALRVAGHDVVTTDIRDDDLGITLGGFDLCDWSDVALMWHQAEVKLDGPVDVVVHLAAQVGRVFGEDNVHLTIESNATMTTLVAQCAAQHEARMVYASTSEVYGDLGDAMAVEDGPTGRKHNLYGVTKGWGEEACRLYATAGYQALRFSMPYGPGLPAGRGRAAIINFLWQAATGQRIPVHAGSERSWCWIGDLTRGVRLVVESGEVWRPGNAEAKGAYNVGRDDARTPMVTVARMACVIAGGDVDQIDIIDAPSNQTVVKRLSDAKLRSLGWAPKVELEDGMTRTWKAIRDHLPAVPR